MKRRERIKIIKTWIKALKHQEYGGKKYLETNTGFLREKQDRKRPRPRYSSQGVLCDILKDKYKMRWLRNIDKSYILCKKKDDGYDRAFAVIPGNINQDLKIPHDKLLRLVNMNYQDSIKFIRSEILKPLRRAK